MAGALAALDAQGVAHGDLQGGNVVMEDRGGVLRACVIDLDNVAAPGLPPPPSVGQVSYYAPEIRRDLSASRVCPATDRFALAVLLHELLLGRHPAQHLLETDPDGFDAVMRAGGWPDDPAGSPHPRNPGGLLVGCLDARLHNLFRRGLAAGPAARPGAAEWLAALRQAAENVYACDACRRPLLVDGGQARCPHCRAAFPAYQVQAPPHPPVRLGTAPVRLSRQELRGQPPGPCHAVLRRHGPDALLEPTGRVPVWRLGGPAPARLAPREPHLLRPGDRLRLGDVEAEVALAP